MMKTTMIYRAMLITLLLSVFSLTLPAQQNYTVIVSMDGFRWDYPAMYSTPNLNSMAKDGISATMLPSFPASTFPNHYTMATGLVPDHHGIVNNSFWDSKNGQRYSMGDSVTRCDPKFFLGEPIWLTAQKQGVKTGVVYWVGSDVKIKGEYPTYYKVYTDKPLLTFTQRVDTAMALLRKPEAERPRLVMVYFSEPDHSGHVYGPHSKEVAMVVHQVDSMIGLIRKGIAALPIADKVNLIVTSDHGMTEISPERVVKIGDYVKPEWCEVIDGTTPTSIFTKKGCRDSVYNALKKVAHINVWKKEEIPAELNYGTSDRIGDIVVAPELGWQFAYEVRGSKGAHGYFPSSPDMQVAFRACGPDFKKGYRSKDFINVDLYPLLAYLLGIVPEKTDGSLERVKDMLIK